MKKVLLSFVAIALATLLPSCAPSADDVAHKIKDDTELTEKDYAVIFDYIDTMMDDADFDSPDFRLNTKEKYPHYHAFSNLLKHTEDPTTIKMWNEFLEKECAKGKDKVYTFNPIYDIIMSKYSDTTDKEAQLVSDYVTAALTSDYKGNELRKHFGYAEALMVNWSNSGESVKINAINKGLDNAIK